MKEMRLTKFDDKKFQEIQDKPIRILHVFSWFNQGGIENFVMNVYRNIDRSKIQFDFAFPISKKGFFDEEAISMGANIYFFDSDKISFSNYYRNLKRIITEHGPYSAVHSHIYYFSGFVLWIAKLCGVKIRVSHSHDTVKGRKPTIIRKMYEKAMKKMIKWNATDRLACSDLAGSYVFGKDIPYSVLYNGIDIDRFLFRQDRRNKTRKALGFTDNNKVILNVGRFVDQKNHEFIIEIFNNLLSISNDYRLVMIGTGPLEDRIREKCKKYGILDRCTFLHNIGNTEDYYCAADAFLLPSHYEGMPIVSVEAQSSGLTSFLSTKITKEVAVTDIIHYFNLEDSAQLWAKHINEIIALPVDRIKYNQKFVNSVFDINRTIKDLTKLYSSCES